jgi:nitrate reductase (cytochrome)
MSDVDRRTFLKGLAALSAVVGAGPAGLAASTAAAGQAQPSARALAWHRAPCRLCPSGCGLLVGVQRGRAVAVKGDPDAPVNRGLACVKGYHAVQTLYGRDRLTRARVRRDGALVDVPLGAALDLVAERLAATVAAHGPAAAAAYGAGDWLLDDAYVAGKLFKGGLGTNNVDTESRLDSAAAAAGLAATYGLPGMVGCYDDIEHADVIVLWNENLAETHPVLFSRVLARRRGNAAVRVVEVATRTTRTSYALDRSLLYAPHAELALAHAVCHELVARRRLARDFVDRHVAFRRGADAAGQDAALRDFVRFLADHTPEQAQRHAGVPAEDVRWLASLYGDPARRVVSIWGAAVHQHPRGTWVNNALHNIHLLVGKVGAPGNGPLTLAGQPGGCGGLHDAGAAAHTLPGGVVTAAADRARAARVWGVPPERLDARPGRRAPAMFQGLATGDVRFLWVHGADPLVTLPELGRMRAAARRAGSFLVVSSAYPTATTDVADVVLPAALWLEREGVAAGGDRRLQHHERLVPPPGDATSSARQLVEVGRRLGLGALFPWADDAALTAGFWAELRRFHEDAGTRLPPLAELRARPGLRWPHAENGDTRWRYATAHDRAADRTQGRYDFYGHADRRARIWLRPYTPASEAPDSQFPFWLATGPVLEHWGAGTLTRRVPTLHRAMPGAVVELHPEDARALGIAGGDVVRLVSRRGTLRIEARMDYRSQPQRGQLFVASFDEGRLVNLLTPVSGCPLSGQPAYGACAVRVERLRPGGAG